MKNVGISACRLSVLIACFVSISVLFGGCSAKKSVVAVADEVTLLNNVEFFDSGLAEVSGGYRVGGQDKARKQSEGTRFVFVYYDDIITGRSKSRVFAVDADSVKFHDWVMMPSPRIVTLKRNGLPDVQVYLQGGKRLGVELGDSHGTTVFSGNLAGVNNDLRDAPVFTMPDSLSRMMASGMMTDWEDVLDAYDKAERIWKEKLGKYCADMQRTEVGRHILYNVPAFTKASWLMGHEKELELSSPQDYDALRVAMAADDPYIMAGKWPGALVKLLAGSDLLRRLAKADDRPKTHSYKEAVMRYMERYDELVCFLGLTGMPQLAQMAVARTLCTGGLLERAGNLEDALAVVDTVAPGYMPSPVVSESVREYARQIFHDEDREVRDTPEGKILKDIIARYAGKNVILDFWGYKCHPCLAEMRDTREVRVSQRGNPDWAIVYVTGEDTTPREEYERIVDKYLEGDETYLLNRNDHLRLTAMFEVTEIPRKVLIGRDGKIIDSEFVFKYDESGEWSNRPR